MLREALLPSLLKNPPKEWRESDGSLPDDNTRPCQEMTPAPLCFFPYVKASLMLGRLGNASDRQMAIAQKAKEALLKIGDENRINKVRVKRYGIYSEERPNR